MNAFHHVRVQQTIDWQLASPTQQTKPTLSNNN